MKKYKDTVFSMENQNLLFAQDLGKIGVNFVSILPVIGAKVIIFDDRWTSWHI